jgi:hypothetical protein
MLANPLKKLRVLVRVFWDGAGHARALHIFVAQPVGCGSVAHEERTQ